MHAGQRPDPNTGARAVPIYQTTSYVFEDPESAAAYFNLQEYGNTYSRIMNPTVAVFEERVASLEGGCGAVAFASGLAAQAAALFTLLTPGDHVVSSAALYGGTVNQLKHVLRKMSVEITWVEPRRSRRVARRRARQHESVLRRDDRQPRRQRARHRGARQASRTSTACRCSSTTRSRRRTSAGRSSGAPTSSLHSATKYLGGHGTSIGGVVVDSGTFNWSNGRFPVVAEPSPAYHGLAFHETFGTYGYLMKLRAETLRDLGAALSPFNAFLFLQGIETLSLRMDRHVANAVAIARYLEKHEQVSNITYPGLPGSQYRPLVEKYLPRGTGSVFSFDIRGGRDAGQEFIRAVTLWSHLANVGDAKSLVIHPASTTHRQLSEAELEAAGVRAGTIRLSVGIENVDDLIWDLEQGFARGARRQAGATRSMTMAADIRRLALSGSADDPARAADREDHRDRRALEQHAAREPFRRVLSAPPRLPRLRRESAREDDLRRAELREPCATCPSPSISSTCSARPMRCPASRRKPSPSARRTCGASSA